MNDGAETDEYLADEVQAMYNARVSRDGDAGERRGGSQRMHTVALNSGAQAYLAAEFYDGSSNLFLVCIMGSAAYTSTDDGENWTEQATGLTVGSWDHTTMQSGSARLLIMVNGTGAPQTFDGTTWTTLAGTGIPSGATMCEFHNDRVWMWGHNNDIMVGSVVSDPTDFSSANGGVTVTIQITQGDPAPRGLWSQGPALLAFSADQVGYVEGWGLNTIQVVTGHRGLSRSLGCINHQTIAAAGENGVIWLSKLGFVYMEQGGKPELISGQVQRFMDGLAWDNMADSTSIPSATWYPLRHEYHCAVPAGGNAQNTHVVVIRPPRLGNPMAVWINRSEGGSGSSFSITDGVLELDAGGDRDAAIVAGVFSLTASGVPGLKAAIVAGVLDLVTVDSIASMLFSADDAGNSSTGELWSAAYDGFVRRLELGDLDDLLLDETGGEAVNAWIRIRPQTFKRPFRRKRLRSSRIRLKAPAGGTLDVYAVADGGVGAVLAEPLTIQDTVQVVRSRVFGLGHALQLDLKFTDDLTIQGAELAAEILRESP